MKKSQESRVFENGLQLGSTSIHKVEAVRQACERLGIQVEIKTCSAESGVNSQPFGLEETWLGAVNRAKNAQLMNPKILTIGIENGIVPIGGKFVDLAIVVALTPDGQRFVGTSAGVEFPKKAVDIAMARGFKTTTAGDIIAETMGGSKTDPHSTLTDGKISRKELLAEAIASILSQI